MVEIEAEEMVFTHATANMLVMELYSKLDDKEFRKTMVHQLLNTLKEEKKISNAVYDKALDILEN